jgi:hypothetical protein
MIFHITVENNYKSYLSFLGDPEVNRADLSCICSLRLLDIKSLILREVSACPRVLKAVLFCLTNFLFETLHKDLWHRMIMYQNIKVLALDDSQAPYN